MKPEIENDITEICEENDIYEDCPHVFNHKGEDICFSGTLVCHGFIFRTLFLRFLRVFLDSLAFWRKYEK